MLFRCICDPVPRDERVWPSYRPESPRNQRLLGCDQSGSLFNVEPTDWSDGTGPSSGRRERAGRPIGGEQVHISGGTIIDALLEDDS